MKKRRVVSSSSCILRTWTVAFSIFGVSVGGCKDQAKESAARAANDDAFLVGLVDKDLAEVERGLPQGAIQMATLFRDGADPRQDVAGVRKALLHLRRDIVDLNLAPSTFFALADSNGVAIRNDLEEDVMAGQNLVAIFPALLKARDGFISTVGRFPNVDARSGPDKDWIAGVPVRPSGGSEAALLVTGWSYRYFARHLQATLQSRLVDESRAAGDEGKLPVYYVAVFDASGVYSAPLTPRVDEAALTGQNLVAKTASGPAQGTIRITERDFGFAAARTPKLAPDTGVVVLRSEL